MGVFLWCYDIGLAGYRLLLGLGSLVHPKARLWVQGRRGWKTRLQAALEPFANRQTRIWMHCASLGEFEQGRVLLDALRQRYPDALLVLSFFSPSGYQHRKSYPSADVVCYLPLDGPLAARDFLDLVRPGLALFVKYEFWYHFIHQLHLRGVPLAVISARFRPDQVFFRPWGGFFRRMLKEVRWFFVQDDPSGELLRGIGIRQLSRAGDTRFDRVAELAARARELPEIERFIAGRYTLVAGSTWPQDERLIAAAWKDQAGGCCILVPHEVHEARIRALEAMLEGQGIRLSAWVTGPHPDPAPRFLIIDRIGWLSSLYRYGQLAYVGGGFQHGIHNTLEAAVYGIPVLFGPRWQAFREAADLIGLGAAQPVSSLEELREAMHAFRDPERQLRAAQAAARYVEQERGASLRILEQLQEKRLLTSS